MLREIIKNSLHERKEALAIPYESIAKRAGVSLRTVKRAFAGEDNTTLDSLEKILSALDCEVAIKNKTPSSRMLQEQIEQKAWMVVGRVVSTSALEDQTPDTQTRTRLYAKAKQAIKKMPPSKVWS
ncbi:MAG: helix-turn-helix domain-containing protein [Campylobacterales bacterium]